MKNNYIQKIRGLLILGVIFIHCMFQCENNLYNCIIIFIRTFCNLSVPIFIFLSAYFYNIQKYKNNPKSYVYQKIKRLIIPLLIWNLIYFIVNYNKLNFKDFITFDTAPQLYFILVLIQLIIITPLLIKGLKNKNIKILLFSITPICLILYRILSIFFHFTFPFYKLFFTNWLIYYLIGLEINMSKKNNNNYKINTPILLIIGGGGSSL